MCNIFPILDINTAPYKAYTQLSETEGLLECNDMRRYAAWPQDQESRLITFDPFTGWSEPVATCYMVICIFLLITRIYNKY